MSYFSRVLVPAGLWLHDPALKRVDPLYRDHQLLWKLFPDQPEHPRDFLFRAETGFNATGPASASVYYLVSARVPQAWHADVQLLTKPYAPRLQAGELVQFSLRANPTISRAGSDGVRGKRHDVLMHAKTQARAQGLSADAIPARVAQAAADWLQQRAAQWGLQLDAPSLQLDPLPPASSVQQRSGNPLFLSRLPRAGRSQRSSASGCGADRPGQRASRCQLRPCPGLWLRPLAGQAPCHEYPPPPQTQTPAHQRTVICAVCRALPAGRAGWGVCGGGCHRHPHPHPGGRRGLPAAGARRACLARRLQAGRPKWARCWCGWARLACGCIPPASPAVPAPTACCIRPGWRWDDEARLSVVREMYRRRFGEEPPQRRSVEQLRGIEGSRVRANLQAAGRAIRREMGRPQLRSKRLGRRPTPSTAACPPPTTACMAWWKPPSWPPVTPPPSASSIAASPCRLFTTSPTCTNLTPSSPPPLPWPPNPAAATMNAPCDKLSRHVPPQQTAGTHHPRHRRHPGRRRPGRTAD